MRKFFLSRRKFFNERIFSFRYTPSNSLFGFRTTGQVGVYDLGGFIKLFGSTLEEFQNEITELKEK